jgi:hypothetical protein
MKALRLGELQELLQSQPFAAWWADFQRAVSAAREARLHDDDLVAQAQLMELRAELAQRAAVDVFTAAGENEEAAARTGAEAQALENRALEIVGAYEDQRFRTSDLWYRLGGAERAVELAREAAAAGRRPETAAALEHAERARRALQAEYEAEDARRTRLWADVEGTWEKAFTRSLLAAETAVRTRGVRREAERLFKEAEERRARGRQLRADADAAGRGREAAEKRRAELLARAGERFGCAPGESFLYWRHRDDQRSAFAVSLFDEPDAYNLEVKALAIYCVGRQRGIAFLEPAREGLGRTAEEGDRRFEEVLLGPRKGTRRDDDGGGPPDPAKA